MKERGERAEGFCGGHGIFQAYIDGPLNTFQTFSWATKYFLKFGFLVLFFKSRGLKHKTSKLAIKEI